uniref:Cystatin domain-containing protein n=1 Tax=Steinernema glaseri TaxID=37863 RepID=A0A1I7Y226_9BILA
MITLPLLLCVLLFSATAIPGGFSDGDPNSPEVQRVAKAALAQENKSANGLKIISVKQQVVAGMR